MNIKIRDVPLNASFSDSNYDVMDEDKICFDDDSDEDSDLDNFIQLLKNVLFK